MSARPEFVAWLDIHDHCRITGEITGDGHAQLTFGDPVSGVTVVVEQTVFARLVELTADMATAIADAGGKIPAYRRTTP